MTKPTPNRYQVTDYKSPIDTRRMALLRDGIVGANLTVATEDEARDLIAQLTAWLDAPRLAARETAEVVARDGNAVLLRTAFEWGVGGAADVVVQDGDTVLPSAAFKWPPPSDDASAALPAAYVVDWYAGPDAERNARSDYANARSLALCICGAEEDEDEIDRSGSSPLCRKCVAEAFKAQRFRCRETDCNVSCGWTGTGADLIAAGDTDGPGSPHECPKCCGWTVYEADDTTGGGQ